MKLYIARLQSAGFETLIVTSYCSASYKSLGNRPEENPEYYLFQFATYSLMLTRVIYPLCIAFVRFSIPTLLKYTYDRSCYTCRQISPRSSQNTGRLCYCRRSPAFLVCFRLAIKPLVRSRYEIHCDRATMVGKGCMDVARKRTLGTSLGESPYAWRNIHNGLATHSLSNIPFFTVNGLALTSRLAKYGGFESVT